MKSSSKFVVAVHILAGLALVYFKRKDQLVSSENIAWSVNTNPVVIRRILGILKKQGLVKTVTGSGGGSQIGRPPDEISLRDIYLAVEERPVFHDHYTTPNSECPVGANIRTALETPLRQAETAMVKALAETKLTDVTDNLVVCLEKHPPETPAV